MSKSEPVVVQNPKGWSEPAPKHPPLNSSEPRMQQHPR